MSSRMSALAQYTWAAVHAAPQYAVDHAAAAGVALVAFLLGIAWAARRLLPPDHHQGG
jgi:hypothetical protein